MQLAAGQAQAAQASGLVLLIGLLLACFCGLLCVGALTVGWLRKRHAQEDDEEAQRQSGTQEFDSVFCAPPPKNAPGANGKRQKKVVPYVAEPEPRKQEDVRLTGAKVKITNAESQRRLWARADSSVYGAGLASAVMDQDQWWKLERDGDADVFKLVNTHSGRQLWADSTGEGWGVSSPGQRAIGDYLWRMKREGEQFLIEAAFSGRRLWACSRSDAWGLSLPSEEVRGNQYWLIELELP